MKVGWILFYLTILLTLSVVCTAAPNIDEIEVDDDIEFERDFDIEVSLRGDAQNSVVNFSIDGYSFVGPQYPDEDDEVKVEWEREDWDRLPGGCGIHTLTVEVWSRSFGVKYDDQQVEVEMGNVPHIDFNPTTPEGSKQLTLTLRDPNTGSPASGVGVEVYYYQDAEIVLSKKNTDSSGSVSFTPQELGKYKATIEDRDYCGNMDFYVKRKMIVDGPHPTDPVVGEKIDMAVPAGGGIGVKIYDDETGEVSQIVPTTIEGDADFNVSDPGEYTIAIGESSTKYWGINKSLTVHEKPKPTVKVTPNKPVVGDVIDILIASRGQTLESALVEITRPDGVSRKYVTGSDGKVRFDSTVNTGRYSVKVSKDRYTNTRHSFEVYHDLSVVYTPQNPSVDENITLSVTDEGGHVIQDVVVEIPKENQVGYTNGQGRYTFKLPKKTDYTILLSKTLFWNESLEITPKGSLCIEVSKEVLELEQMLEIKCVNNQNQPVTSSRIIVENPQGIKETFTQSLVEYTPETAGEYKVYSEKEGFTSETQTFTVNPLPLTLANTVEGGRLKVILESRGQPVEGIPVAARRRDFNTQSQTDPEGVALLDFPGPGNLTLTVNNQENPLYESKSI
ncbi:MAG: hypothetical protein GF334_01735, partial [Candidatus Altiarchaeales archaeon]|nr:hypothetical protein [Candidatus Altiarchaeales archaeon]